MNKIKIVLSAIVVAFSMLFVTAQPSSAAVLGSVWNASDARYPARWIAVSNYYPLGSDTIKLMPGYINPARSFTPNFNCYSIWGYKYVSGRNYGMNTTGVLKLTCY